MRVGRDGPRSSCPNPAWARSWPSLAASIAVGFLVLAAFGQALGAKSRHQRGADLAAISAARTMRGLHPRLFEPARLLDGSPNPRHLPLARYLARARGSAVRAARRNGVALRTGDVRFADDPFAPTRVTVRVRGSARIRVQPDGRRRRHVSVKARATAELSPADAGLGMPGQASGGGYSGPLAYRQGN